MTARLFGTDGIRGVAGQYPLDHQTVRRLGAALVRALPHGSAKLLVGRDTRESGGWIEAELAHGASGAGARVTSAGIVPTPAIAYLTRAAGYDAGVVISASHNPFEDNGIKVFSGRGENSPSASSGKWKRSWRTRRGTLAPATPAPLGLSTARISSARTLDHLRAILPESSALKGFRLAIDCANGATTTAAPALLGGLGVELVVIGNTPDGRNINLGCGSTHPEALARTVVERRCRMGVAFDGDGDRAIFVDEHGHVINGDAVLLMCGQQLQSEGRLTGNTIAATVMSNVGLELALRDRGIGLVRCAGRRQVRDGRDARPRPVARRRAIGPRDFLGISLHGRWPLHGVERAPDDGS